MGKPRYGWIVTVERCKYLDAGNACIFNVNLARPWSDAEVPKDPNAIRGPTLPDANTRIADLLYPWCWNYNAAGWRYFGNSAAAGQTPVWRKLDGKPVTGGEPDPERG